MIMKNINLQITAAFYQLYDIHKYTLKNIMCIPDMYGNPDDDIFVIEYIDKSKRKPKTLEWNIMRRDVTNK